jgi:hypothetical protein
MMKKLMKISITTFVVMMIIGALNEHLVFADLEEKSRQVLINYPELFTENNMGWNMLNIIGWMILQGAAFIADACATLYDTCFGFVDFTTYARINRYIDKWKPVFVAIVCLSIFFMGVILILWHEKKPKVMINLCIAVLVISSGTYILSEFNSYLNEDFRTAVMGNGKNAIVYETIGGNIHDLRHLDVKYGLSNLDDEKAKQTLDKLTKKKFLNIDINELYTPDDTDKEDSKDLLSYRVSPEENDSGKTYYEVEELSSGVAWTDLLNEYYYRYSVDYMICLLELISLIIVYLCLSYKVVRILYEIAISRLLAYLYSANLSGGKKILKILDSIKDSYIVLIFTMVSLKFYYFATKFVSQEMDVNGLTKGMILLFVAFSVIDGPNLVQKLTGIDAGLQSGWGKIMAAMSIGRTVGRGAASIGRGAGHIGSKAGHAFMNSDERTGGHPDFNTATGEAFGAGAAGASYQNEQNENQNQNNLNGGNANSSMFNNQNQDNNNHLNNNEQMNSSSSENGNVFDSGQNGSADMSSGSVNNMNSEISENSSPFSGMDAGKEFGTSGNSMRMDSNQDALNGMKMNQQDGKNPLTSRNNPKGNLTDAHNRQNTNTLGNRNNLKGNIGSSKSNKESMAAKPIGLSSKSVFERRSSGSGFSDRSNERRASSSSIARQEQSQMNVAAHDALSNEDEDD